MTASAPAPYPWPRGMLAARGPRRRPRSTVTRHAGGSHSDTRLHTDRPYVSVSERLFSAQFPARSLLGGIGHQLCPHEREGLTGGSDRSEEHTSELQSQSNLVCRLLLEKKKKKR